MKEGAAAGCCPKVLEEPNAAAELWPENGAAVGCWPKAVAAGWAKAGAVLWPKVPKAGAAA